MHTNLCTEVAYKPISAETPSFWVFGYQVCATRTSHALPLPLLLIFPRRGNETRSHPPQGEGKSDFPNASETLERLPKTYRVVVVGRIWGTLSATVARDWGQLGSHRTSPVCPSALDNRRAGRARTRATRTPHAHPLYRDGARAAGPPPARPLTVKFQRGVPRAPPRRWPSL